MTRLPSLNALRAFHVVAGAPSLAAAAEELGVTASAVSRQISNLEEHVGVALLVRDGRGLRLTADGRTLENGLAGAFGQIADAVKRLERPMARERLRVLVPPIFASSWLIPRLDRFYALRPETEVILIDCGERVGLTSASELVVTWGQHSGESDAKRLSEREEIFPVCSPHAGLAEGLAGATLLHRETIGKGWSWPDWPDFLRAVGLSGIDRRSGPRLTPGLLLDATRRGKGVMLANITIAHDGLSEGWLVRPTPEKLETENGYWLLVARTELDRPEVLAFCNWLREEFAICFDRRDSLVA